MQGSVGGRVGNRAFYPTPIGTDQLLMLILHPFSPDYEKINKIEPSFDNLFNLKL